MKDQQHIRRCRLAIEKLYSFWHDMKYMFVDDELYELIVLMDSQNLKFGVKVGGYDFTSSEDFKHNYLNALQSKKLTSENLMPIAVMGVNENTLDCCFGIVLSVRWKMPRINLIPIMRKMTIKNKDGLLNIIKESDYIIRALSDKMMGVLKTITFQMPNIDRSIVMGKIAYLRNFSYEYNMNSKEVIDKREKFMKQLTGISQEEYPHDYLDEVIFKALESKFENCKINNSMFLFSVDQAVERRSIENLHFCKLNILIEPLIDIDMMAILGGYISIPNINLTIFSNFDFNRIGFMAETIKVIIPQNEWKKNYEKITSLMPTLTDLKLLLN